MLFVCKPVSQGMICCVLAQHRLTQVLVQNCYHNESAAVWELDNYVIFMLKRKNAESKLNKDRANLFVYFIVLILLQTASL